MQVNRKDELVASFQKLLESWKTRERQVLTREEKTRREQERQILDTASSYTSDAIIRDLTELQMHFTRSLETLANTAVKEDERMNEINRAIEIETRRIEELRSIRTAADAIDILRQEQDAEIRAFEDTSKAERDALTREIEETRTAWELENEAFQKMIQEEEDELKRTREQAEEEFNYEQERKRKKERDEFRQKKQQLERDLRDQEEAQTADWEEREALMDARREQLEDYRQQLEHFEKEKEEAVRRAREAAIRQTQEDVELKAAAFERDVTARRKTYETRIQLLESEVSRQNEQIEQLSAQLQAAIQQAQNLAGRAMESRK